MGHMRPFAGCRNWDGKLRDQGKFSIGGSLVQLLRCPSLLYLCPGGQADGYLHIGSMSWAPKSHTALSKPLLPG